jgi:hypothetical protein
VRRFSCELAPAPGKRSLALRVPLGRAGNAVEQRPDRPHPQGASIGPQFLASIASAKRSAHDKGATVLGVEFSDIP